MKSFANVAVAKVFEDYPPNMRRKLLALRELNSHDRSVHRRCGRHRRNTQVG